MNFIGHIAVARAIAPNDYRYHLGAALPDLAAMSRVRITGEATNREIADGIGLHYRTDDAFHGHELFLGWSKAVTAGLTERGLGRGAARACGHVGVELLLDGHWLATDHELGTGVRRALGRATDPALALDRLVDGDHREDWLMHLGRAATWPLPDDYRQPAAVARRLQRILASRPRLAFEDSATATVAAVLADHQITIEWGASQILADVVAESR